MTEITKNFSEPKPEFLKLFNIGRSLLGKASWRQSLEIKEAVALWFSEIFACWIQQKFFLGNECNIIAYYLHSQSPNLAFDKICLSL